MPPASASPALVLVEPPPLRAVRAPDGRRRRLGPGAPQRVWRRVRSLAAQARAATAAGRLHETPERVLRARWPWRGHVHDPTESRQVERTYADAVRRYVGGRYPGTVTCIRTRASLVAGEFDPEVWRQVVDRLLVEVVPGDHESCLATEARSLAARLRAGVMLAGPP